MATGTKLPSGACARPRATSTLGSWLHTEHLPVPSCATTASPSTEIQTRQRGHLATPPPWSQFIRRHSRQKRVVDSVVVALSQHGSTARAVSSKQMAQVCSASASALASAALIRINRGLSHRCGVVSVAASLPWFKSSICDVSVAVSTAAVSAVRSRSRDLRVKHVR